MKESEYITATNLAKLRMANYVLRDCLFPEDDSFNKKRLREAIIIVGEMIDSIERAMEDA